MAHLGESFSEIELIFLPFNLLYSFPILIFFEISLPAYQMLLDILNLGPWP